MKQMKHVRAEIVPLIRDVCWQLTGQVYENAVRLLLGTAAAESSFTERRQREDGPARGLWGMEPETAWDIFENYLRFSFTRHEKLVKLWLDFENGTHLRPVQSDLARHLEKYDDFACAMARVKYLRDPDPIPETLEGQAEYWKKIYNTPAGAGTVEHYLSQWEACNCKELLEVT